MVSQNAIDVVILCGGLGKRLRPEIGNTPKVMAKIGERPFLDLLIGQAAGQGFKRVVLCTGYQAQTVEDYYRKNPQGLTIEFSRELTPLGTGGALKEAKTIIKSDPFIVLNGDSFCPLSFSDVLEFHQKKKALASLVVSEIDETKDFGSIILDASGRVTAFQEKAGTKAGYVNAGVYVFSRDIFKHMPQAEKFSLEHDFFPSLAGLDVYGRVTKEKFLDIGTPERYATAQKLLKKKGG